METFITGPVAQDFWVLAGVNTNEHVIEFLSPNLNNWYWIYSYVKEEKYCLLPLIAYAPWFWIQIEN